MLYESSFYQVVNMIHESDCIIYSLVLNSEHEIYNAHFQDYPITPGVCIIQIVKEIVEKQFGKNVVLKSGKNIRFYSILVPSEHNSVSCKIYSEETTDSIYVDAVVYDNNIIFSKLSKLVYESI